MQLSMPVFMYSSDGSYIVRTLGEVGFSSRGTPPCPRGGEAETECGFGADGCMWCSCFRFRLGLRAYRRRRSCRSSSDGGRANGCVGKGRGARWGLETLAGVGVQVVRLGIWGMMWELEAERRTLTVSSGRVGYGGLA